MKRPLCIFMMLIALSVWLLMAVMPYEEHLTVPDQASVTKIGFVEGKEKKKDTDVVYLKVPGEEGLLMLYLTEGQEVPAYGRVIKVRGKCMAFQNATNPGEFDSKSYYRILKISYRIVDVRILDVRGSADVYKESLYKIKTGLEESLEKCMDEKDAGVMEAILLGDKNKLDDEIKDSYKRNGIIHIIAVSGLHISIIGFGLYKLLRRMSLHTFFSALLSIFIMYSYGVMCGMSTSAYRAIFMFVAKVLADVIGRTYDMLSAMALCAILILIEQPLYLSHSGFLMSFGAIIGIGYVLPALPEWLREGRLKIFSAGTAITLVNLPVYTSFYYTFPVISAILNILVLPLMSLLILFGLATAFAGCLVIGLGKVFAVIVHFILSWFMVCCLAGEQIYGSTWYVGHSEKIQVFIYLLCLFIFVFFNEYRIKPVHEWLKTKPKKLRKAAGYLRYVAIAAGLVILCIRIKQPLTITFIDVGQGDGIVLETPDANYLIDGGSTSKKNLGKYQLIPFLAYEGIGKLDAVILTHEDEDHLSGIIELFEDMSKNRGSIQVKNLILPDIADESKGENYKKLEEYAKNLNIAISYIGRGDKINSGYLYMKCLGPVSGMQTDEPNAYSTVMYVKLRSFKALFTGDVEKEGQSSLKSYIKRDMEEFENITLLKVAHHGSRYTTDEEFLNMIKPKIAVISCGVNNKYNHPHRELLKRLGDAGSSIYTTAENGAITVTTNGKTMQISNFCK
ncbi:MAG: DNA internalization-related competence protein ComEC/Rec2 [Butyrivibrio sp.]|nr:DNA internalization-related competence protein ComEC/Rec2 [Butyrivibrio sp.]